MPIRNLLFRLTMLSSFSLLILVVAAASAHPGKTDYQDGHKCLKNCEDWNLYYSEYHLHDKDRNPIRVKRKRKAEREAPAKKSALEPAIQEAVIVPVPSSPAPQAKEIRATEPVGQGYSMPVEEGCMPTSYENVLLGVAGLLLLLMLLLRRKERKDNSL